MDMGLDHLKELQETDETLAGARVMAMEGAEGYFKRDGVIYRQWQRPGLSSGPDCATSELPREGTGTGTHNSIGRSPGEEEDNRSSGAALLLAYGVPRCGKVLQELCCVPEIEPWTYPQSTNDSSPCCRGAIRTHSHGYSGTTAKEQSW